MKRLFRTSKANGTVDPLPPPPPTPPNQLPPPQQQAPVKKSFSSMMMAGMGGDRDKEREAQLAQSRHQHHSHHSSHSTITPFPVDIPPAPPPKGAKHGAPSLLEIQQQSAQTQPMRPPRPGYRDEQQAYHENASPDGWSVVSHPSPAIGYVPPQLPASRPLSGSSPNSTPTATNLYLPPGARPPSPQIIQAGRPGTPTRPSYPSSLGHSQTSLASLAHAHGPDAEYAAPNPVGRDRGYSSASASHSVRGSDHEGSSAGHGGMVSPIPPHPAKLSKPPQPPFSSRSPLANTYDPNSAPAAFPVPSPHPYGGPPAAVNPYSPLSDDMSGLTVHEPAQPGALNTAGADKKEKKSFWGMGKTREKPKDRGIESTEERRSVDVWRDRDADSASHGERGRLMGMDMGARERGVAEATDVTSAIKYLCAHPDPPLATIYEICDRINQSHSADAVGKEAAQAIRKVFKHGNEAERRTAGKVWLIMMRNVQGKAFKTQAGSKKLLSTLEPILLASASKPLVSVPTHRLLCDILADLTYAFGGEKGCEGLLELWRKVKMPQDPEFGYPLPSDHPIYTPSAFYDDLSHPASRHASSLGLAHMNGSVPAPIPHRSFSPSRMGPPVSRLPNHGDDMRRLVDESTAAKESARVLSEALVYTRPSDLDSKPIIKEFYQKCFLAYESLTNQIEWAQAEAAQSRERAIMAASANGLNEEAEYKTTLEEQALSALFEAHSALGEAIKHHDDLERMAMDEMELREVRERSKKDTRMDRSAMNDNGGLSVPDKQPTASSSRSPSPSPHARLHASPRGVDIPLPPPRADFLHPTRSRTPSPDSHPHPLPHPPKIPNSPSRTASPLGKSNVRPGGARPLPNPFDRGNPSQQSLAGTGTASRQGTGSTDHSGSGSGERAGEGDDEAEVDEAQVKERVKPSRKALGKRRAVVDEDNHFDPNDMFNPAGGADPKARPAAPASESSDESVLADEVYTSKPINYAYDAYQEKLQLESRRGSIADTSTRAASRASMGGDKLGGGSGAGLVEARG